MKKDQSLKPAKGTQRKKIEGEAADPRKALFAAIQSIGTNDDDSSPKPTPVDPRQARFAAIKNKGAEASTTSTPGANVKYSRGVKRLESFIREAEDSLSFTERDQNAALRACKVSMVILYMRIDKWFSSLLHVKFCLLSIARILRLTVERKEARDLPRHCCKIYQPFHLLLRQQSRSMTKEQSFQSGKRHRAKEFRKRMIRKIKLMLCQRRSNCGKLRLFSRMWD
jgi:hypothetical protein